jgi:hypothetical protein
MARGIIGGGFGVGAGVFCTYCGWWLLVFDVLMEDMYVCMYVCMYACCWMYRYNVHLKSTVVTYFIKDRI